MPDSRPTAPPTTTPPLGTAVPALFSIRGGRNSVGVALRTSIATVAPVAIGHWLSQPLWVWAALGAYITALADVVDTYERQVRMAVLVTVGCGLTTVLGTVAATWMLWAFLAMTFVIAVAGSAIRGLGRTIGTAGFFMILAYVAAAGTPAGWDSAFIRGACVFGGGVWATAIILTRWVRGADRPVFLTVAYPYEQLAKLARLVARQEDGSARAERETLRAHRDVRDAVSLAHDTVARERPGATTLALHTVIDDADHLFGLILAFGEAVAATPVEARSAMAEVATALERLSVLLASTVQHRAPMSDLAVLQHAIARVEAAVKGACSELHAASQKSDDSAASASSGSVSPAMDTDHAFSQLLILISQVATQTINSVLQLGEIVQNVPPSRRVVPTLPMSADPTAWMTQELRIPALAVAKGDTALVRQSTLWTHRLRHVLDQYVTPESPVGRHALRMGIACTIAELVARLTQLEHAQWVALTVLVVLQPDLGTTFRRGVHRILGTVVGGMLAAGLAAALPSAVTTIFVLFPLLFVTVLLAPIHYALFSVFVTPTFVLFAESHPGDWHLALIRVANTCIGGALALIAARVLWPVSERTRVGPYLAAVLRSLARYVRVIAERQAPIGTEEWMTYRAAVGRANTAAEDSVIRWSGEQVRSPTPVRSAASLVLSARGLAAAATWVAIIGDDAASVSPMFLHQLATAVDTLASAITDGKLPTPLALTPHQASLLERRLYDWTNHLHAAAMRFARG